MTSLSYGTWVPSPESADSGKPRKRMATYDKPPKQTSKPSNDDLLDVNDLELNLKNTQQNLSDYSNTTEKKQSEIHDLLDQMNRENFENDSDHSLKIQPMEPPRLIQKPQQATNVAAPAFIFPQDSEVVSNYQTIYNQGTTYRPAAAPAANVFPYATRNGDSSQQALLEKLNYMIYLLERQQNEKTDHIWEEFVLYCFLGIFMIYIVDGFARTGAAYSMPSRYTR